MSWNNNSSNNYIPPDNTGGYPHPPASTGGYPHPPASTGGAAGLNRRTSFSIDNNYSFGARGVDVGSNGGGSASGDIIEMSRISPTLGPSSGTPNLLHSPSLGPAATAISIGASPEATQRLDARKKMEQDLTTALEVAAEEERAAAAAARKSKRRAARTEGNANDDVDEPDSLTSPRPHGAIPGVDDNHGTNPLTGKLKQIEGLIDEFFDDRDLQLSQKSQGQEGTRTMPALVSYMNRVPILPDSKPTLAKKTEKKVKKKKKKKTIAAVFASVHTKTLDEILLRHDFVVCLISMSGVLLMLIGSIIGWESRRPDCGGSPEPAVVAQSTNSTADELKNKIGQHFDNAVVTLHYLILFTTVASIAAIVNYYRIITRQKQMEWCRLNGKEIMPRAVAYNFLKSKHVILMVAEILIHLAAPTPWFHSSEFNDVKYLDLFMFFRLYTVLRLLHHYSPLYRFRHDIVRSDPELKTANFQVRFADTMKVYFYINTWGAGFAMWMFCVLVGGFVVWIAERDQNNGVNVPYPGLESYGFCSFFDGVYFMVVSVRTIGYGEMKPITVVGRLSTVFFQFAGMAVEALLGSVVINKIAKSKEEKIIDEYLMSFHAWHELRVSSAMLIQSTWKTCARYKYLHHKVSREHMERLLRSQRRHQEFLSKINVAATTFNMPSYSDLKSETKALQIKGARLRFENENVKWNQLGLKKILMHFADTRSDSTKESRAKERKKDPMNHIYERMPYRRKKKETIDSAEYIERFKKMFSSDDVDMARWGRTVSSKTPRDFQPLRKFTATKKVVGRYGERRVPVGEGHKADIQQEALKMFRQARQEFKMSIATSSDHVVDAKLYLAYELLKSASRKVKRNSILLKGLRAVAEEQLDAIERLLMLASSGGTGGDL